MKSKTKKKRVYDATGRREEAERTTARIVETASKLLRSVRPEQLSYGDVAELSGVAVRTVYRHFPETSDLLRAVARATIARFAPAGISDSRAEVAGQLAAFHGLMSSEPTLFRVFMAAPIRSELDYTDKLKSFYGEALAELSQPQATAVLGLLDLLLSPFAWEVLHTQWQLPPERITRACLAASQLLAEGFRRHPDWLEPNEQLPPMFRAPNAPSTKRKDKQ